MSSFSIHTTCLWPYVSICCFCFAVGINSDNGGNNGDCDDSGNPSTQYRAQSWVVDLPQERLLPKGGGVWTEKQPNY